MGYKQIWMTCGVPQGSVIGSTLWNAQYDELLEMTMLQGAKLIGFTDDIAVTVTIHNHEFLKQLVNPVLNTVNK